MAEPVETPAVDPVPDRWVCLEVFGHRQHYGRLTEVEQFGAKFARIEVTCANGHPWLAPTYAGAAIFSVTDLPGGEAAARKRTGSYGCPTCPKAALPPWSEEQDHDPDDGVPDEEDGDFDPDDRSVPA